MSEEVLKKEEAPLQEEQKEEVKEESKELSSIEQKALEMGWKPKEEFDGDETEYIDAGEYVRRRPLFDKIEHQSKELKDVKKALRMLQDHHTKVREVEYQHALQDLRNQYKEALEAGDADKVTKLTEQIADVKAEEKATKVNQQTQASQPHPDFLQWVEKNLSLIHI